MEIKRGSANYGGGVYYFYVCPRCEGTMAWEREKSSSPFYLKCILCGEEIRSFSKNKQKRQEILPESSSEAEKLAENNENKTGKKDYKWQFVHTQKENK